MVLVILAYVYALVILAYIYGLVILEGRNEGEYFCMMIIHNLCYIPYINEPTFCFHMLT